MGLSLKVWRGQLFEVQVFFLGLGIGLIIIQSSNIDESLKLDFCLLNFYCLDKLLFSPPNYLPLNECLLNAVPEVLELQT